MARMIDGIHFLTTSDFESEHRVEKYERDISEKVSSLSADMYAAAFMKGDEVLICLASMAAEKQTAAFATDGIFEPSAEYSLTVYSSETGDHTTVGPYSGEDLSKLSAWIEPGGFTLFSFSRMR